MAEDQNTSAQVPAPRPAVVPNYLVWSILTTLFCCLPLGVVSLINAAKVDSLVAGGDHDAARVASAQAKKFAIWAAATWGVAMSLYVLFFVLLAVLGSAASY